MVVEKRMIRGFQVNWNLLVVLGPTASGKTELAVRLARKIDGEIISADSRQVYRDMDLGTGKDRSVYSQGGAAVPAHLIDVCDPDQEFNVFTFQKLFYICFQEIVDRGKIPILVGGTGLYLDSVLRGYRMPAVPFNHGLREKLAGEDRQSLCRLLRSLRPNVHNTTDLMNPDRLIRAIEIAEYSRNHPQATEPPAPVSPLVIGIRCNRKELRGKITFRLQNRLESGMITEVQRLRERNITWKRLESFGLEYRYISLYLRQKITREEMFRTLNTRIHQFAKRQETWFRRMERNGIQIHWIEGSDEDIALRLLLAGPPS